MGAKCPTLAQITRQLKTLQVNKNCTYSHLAMYLRNTISFMWKVLTVSELSVFECCSGLGCTYCPSMLFKANCRMLKAVLSD